MARRNNIWERLWESTGDEPTVTIKIPRALAEDLLSAISAGISSMDDGDMGDMDMDDDGLDVDMGQGHDAFGDMDQDADDEDALVLFGGDDDDDGDSDKDDSDDDDDDDDKDEGKDCATDGMRPKTALGEKYIGFDKLAKKVGAGTAAEIGRKKYGKDKFQAAAAKGKKLR